MREWADDTFSLFFSIYRLEQGEVMCLRTPSDTEVKLIAYGYVLRMADEITESKGLDPRGNGLLYRNLVAEELLKDIAGNIEKILGDSDNGEV